MTCTSLGLVSLKPLMLPCMLRTTCMLHPCIHVEKNFRNETRKLGSDICMVPRTSRLTAHCRRVGGLCARTPTAAILCGTDHDAMVESGWSCAMSQAQLSVFSMDQPGCMASPSLLVGLASVVFLLASVVFLLAPLAW